MKRLLIPLLALLSAVASAQVGPIVITATTDPCAQIAVGSKGAQVVITVTGTFSATLQPEVSVQGQAAANTQVTPSTSSTAQSTITAVGTYFTVNVAGADTFLVCMTSHSSGTATVYLNLSTASSKGSGGGGGGTGTVTSVATTSPLGGGTITTTGTLTCSTCTTATTPTAHGVILGAGTQALGVTAAGSTGQVLTGNTGADPTWQAAASGGATMFPLENCSPDTSGNVFWTAVALTNWRFQHWEWNKSAAFGGTDVVLYCSIKIPHTLPSGTAKIVMDLSANDGTASHTMTFKSCDIVESTTVDAGSLTCQSTQNFTTTSTAYAPSTLTFGVNATLAADNIMVVAIHATAESTLSNNVLLTPPRLEFQ